MLKLNWLEHNFQKRQLPLELRATGRVKEKKGKVTEFTRLTTKKVRKRGVVPLTMPECYFRLVGEAASSPLLLVAFPLASITEDVSNSNPSVNGISSYTDPCTKVVL